MKKDQHKMTLFEKKLISVLGGIQTSLQGIESKMDNIDFSQIEFELDRIRSIIYNK